MIKNLYIDLLNHISQKTRICNVDNCFKLIYLGNYNKLQNYFRKKYSCLSNFDKTFNKIFVAVAYKIFKNAVGINRELETIRYAGKGWYYKSLNDVSLLFDFLKKYEHSLEKKEIDKNCFIENLGNVSYKICYYTYDFKDYYIYVSRAFSLEKYRKAVAETLLKANTSNCLDILFK